MFVKTESHGITEEDQHDVMIFALEENGVDVVLHAIGSEEVVIKSNLDSWGGIPVAGRDHLRLIRDAFINICETEGIE